MAFNSVNQQLELTCTLNDTKILLDPITMACTIARRELETLNDSTETKLKQLYFSDNIQFPTVVKATATITETTAEAALVGDHFAVINNNGADDIYFQQSTDVWLKQIGFDGPTFPNPVVEDNTKNNILSDFLRAMACQPGLIRRDNYFCMTST